MCLWILNRFFRWLSEGGGPSYLVLPTRCFVLCALNFVLVAVGPASVSESRLGQKNKAPSTKYKVQSTIFSPPLSEMFPEKGSNLPRVDCLPWQFCGRVMPAGEPHNIERQFMFSRFRDCGMGKINRKG